MSRFIETIRFENGGPCRLDLHEERVAATYAHFYSEPLWWNLEQVLTSQKAPSSGICKCRITYDEVVTAIEFEAYTISTIQSLKLIEARDIDYKYKYADRRPISQLFDQRDAADDILMIVEGNVTDTSFGNIALMDNDGKWYTPSSCLLNGTMRRWLIQTGRIFERPVNVNELPRFRSFRVINALRGWDTTPAQVSDIE